MSVQFYHGSRVIDHGLSRPLFQTALSNVIWLQGTAPGADEKLFDYNTPYKIGPANRSDVLRLGSSGTITDEIANIWRQGGEAEQLGVEVLINIIEEGATFNETLSNHVGSKAANTGIHAVNKVAGTIGEARMPRIFCAPGFTSVIAVDGINAVNVTNGGANYGPNTFVAWTGGGNGFGAQLKAVIKDGAVDMIIPEVRWCNVRSVNSLVGMSSFPFPACRERK